MKQNLVWPTKVRTKAVVRAEMSMVAWVQQRHWW